MLQLLDVSRSFGEKQVLHSLTCTLPDKGCFALMGPSGVGKTTLLRLIAGVDHPDTGEIRSSHKQVSISFQEPRLLPWMSCRDNLLLVLAQKENAAKIADKWLKLFELEEAADQFPSALSGGMQQRLSLARALCFGGDLYLLDEPFSALDQSLKERLAPIIKKATENALVLLVTHDDRDVRLLDARALACKGDPITALEEY